MRKIYHYWKRGTERVGNIQTIIIFSLLYFVIVTPLGLIANLVIDIFKTRSKPQWSDVDAEAQTIDKMTVQ